ncbi:MAG: guanylate kinase [Chloroflexi bacterium]|nr:guanylate kinase [Chloroflexota bacterium]
MDEQRPSAPLASPLLVVLSGPSGVGKDAALKRMDEMGCPLTTVVTATTRPQRPGEVHARDYLFLSPQEFDRLLEQGEFLEHATVYGHRYGVPKQQVREALARGEDVLIKADVQGAATIRSLVPQAVLIFLAAPSLEELAVRLRQRKTESEDELGRRLRTAERELEQQPRFDYVVVNHNDRLDEAVSRIQAIVEEEKRRGGRPPVRL